MPTPSSIPILRERKSRYPAQTGRRPVVTASGRSPVSENTGLGREVAIDDNRSFMKQALARRFGPPGVKQRRTSRLSLSVTDNVVSATGGQFTSTQAVESTPDKSNIDLPASAQNGYSPQAPPTISSHAFSRPELGDSPPRPSERSAGKRPLIELSQERNGSQHGHLPLPHTLKSARELLYQQRHPLGDKDLHKELCRARRYLSDFTAWEILTLPVVQQLLNECDLLVSKTDGHSRDLNEIAQRICGRPKSQDDDAFISYRKLFAALILSGQYTAIFDFVQKGLHDGDLPLTCLKTCSDPHEHGVRCSSATAIFSTWESPDVDEFDGYQWELCAPFFQLDKSADSAGRCLHYQFSERVSLPLDSADEVLGPDGQVPGGFSHVFRVEINNNHHDFPLYTVRPLQPISCLTHSCDLGIKSLTPLLFHELRSRETRRSSYLRSRSSSIKLIPAHSQTTRFSKTRPTSYADLTMLPIGKSQSTYQSCMPRSKPNHLRQPKPRPTFSSFPVRTRTSGTFGEPKGTPQTRILGMTAGLRGGWRSSWWDSRRPCTSSMTSSCLRRHRIRHLTTAVSTATLSQRISFTSATGRVSRTSLESCKLPTLVRLATIAM